MRATRRGRRFLKKGAALAGLALGAAETAAAQTVALFLPLARIDTRFGLVEFGRMFGRTEAED